MHPVPSHTTSIWEWISQSHDDHPTTENDGRSALPSLASIFHRTPYDHTEAWMKAAYRHIGILPVGSDPDGGSGCPQGMSV